MAIALDHGAQIALVGLWLAVAITALPFTLTWEEPFFHTDRPAHTKFDPSAAFAALMWPVIPFSVLALLVGVAVMLPVMWLPGQIVKWWNRPWSAPASIREAA